ncbi:hybrid sensor histidine kinase/response regulator [Halorubrum sp. 48-1-W]|uniref:PAS domain-containing protein n=1 Tax=Halorubrum sp. 48-1-W TaxID=2249761 RepID=UPI000DCF33EF|nr:PAS domain-containing protein [Halorubrum sp. 48-1-W]RAW46989.1 hybrid sensor histidine kinase/response regulator [Halorubrum sp. 48-1-W]
MTERIDVLHVDDDPSVLDLTEAYLDRELASVSVTGVTDPETGLKRLAADSFDCVVSDYDMSGMDGLAFFEALRADHPTVPFVLYTGKGSEEIASRALNVGVTGYFQKGGPEQLQRLATRVRQAVAESRTRRVADRYSTVLEALGYPVYVVDETGTFEYVNEPFAKLTGYDREEILGSKPDLIKDEKAVREAEDRLGPVLSSEGPAIQRFHVDIVPKEGDPIPCRDHMAVLPYEGEEFEGSVGILRDVSTETARSEELETKRRALEEAPVGITITDPSLPDNPMVYVNERFVGMTGYDCEEAVGVNCRFLQGPGTDEDAVAELREAIDAGEPESVELLNYRKDGTAFWNRVSIAPIREAAADPVIGWVGFQEDITAFKEREEALRRQNERLDEFAGIVSHDLRSPLNVARGRVDLAREETGNEHLEAAVDALDRIESIVEHTLTLAREGQTVGDPEPVDVAELAGESWETVDTERAGFEVVADGTVLADPDRLRNLFENLFRNAIEHGGTAVDDPWVDANGADDAGAPATVTVLVGDLADGFYVADDGPGIPAAVRDNLFQPGATGTEGNTGFGLAIVKEIATAHGWTVEATESEAGGARFEIRGVDRPAPSTS